MTHESEPRFLVLHGLRLKGFAAEMAVARATGLAPEEVDSHLEELAQRGLARRREGRVSGWTLTPEGRALHAETARLDLSTAACRDVVEGAYRRFLELNTTLLTVCTDWQLRAPAGGEAVLNDHHDEAYDRGVISRLRRVDEEARVICADLAAVMARYGAYGSRLHEALERVEAGQREFFTGTQVESYHAVWFELHEDLLATLGLGRESEVAG